MKKLTDNQQKIINSLVEEFTKENNTAKKVNIKNVIQSIEDKISFTKQQEKECKEFNTLEGKKAEAFMEDLIKKIAPIAKKYNIEINRSYSGFGLVRRAVYLSFKAFWKGYGRPQIHTLCIETTHTTDKIGSFYKENWAGIKVGYPTYKNRVDVNKDHEAIINEIAEWLMYYKEQEVKEKAEAGVLA
jgi:hypothetical protein